MKYSIASNWDSKLFIALKKINTQGKKDKVIELFGSSHFNFFGYAAPTPTVSTVEIEKKIKKIKKDGFKFNYLINASTCPNLNSKDQLKKAVDYVAWIKKQKVDFVTIGNEKVLSFVCKHFPELKVNISVVLLVKTVRKVNSLRKRYPNIRRITLYQAVNRDRNKLIQHIANAHKRQRGLQPVQIELLANEICLYNCSLMKKHYAYSSKISQSNNGKHKVFDKFDIKCNKTRLENPIEFLNACWIRPEDVEIYEKLGVDMLKIAGKTALTDYLIKIVKLYTKRSYSGNAMDLFSSDWWPERKKPYINNFDLNGFIEYLWSKNLKKISSFKNLDEKYNIKYK